jgi:hypothetical protein
MKSTEPNSHRPVSFLKKARYWLYHQWAGLYSRWMEVFNEKWREPLPPVPCQICGKTGHSSRTCPQAKDMGF